MIKLKLPMAMGLLALLQPGTLLAQTVTANPRGSGPILEALNWMQGTLLGNLATSAAVIAVAVCGLLMLTGRMNWRLGATVIMGCFILFGATAIVSGIRSVATGGG
jgi:type IV secretory pathway VirB2 component (pilin)